MMDFYFEILYILRLNFTEHEGTSFSSCFLFPFLNIYIWCLCLFKCLRQERMSYLILGFDLEVNIGLGRFSIKVFIPHDGSNSGKFKHLHFFLQLSTHTHTLKYVLDVIFRKFTPNFNLYLAALPF